MNTESKKTTRSEMNTMLKSANGATDGKSKPSMAERLAMNALNYDFDSSFPAIRSRSKYVNDANKSSYESSETASVILNSGSQFTWGPGCTLNFDIKNTSTGSGALSFKNKTGPSQGSAANVLDSIIIVSASGQELERIEGLGLLTGYRIRYSCAKDWQTSGGSSFYYGEDLAIAAAATASVSIPMGLISGLFASKKLLPPQALAGARIEFTWAPAQTAFVNSVAVATSTSSYQINNLRIWTDAVQLEDSVQLEIQKRAAKSGLSLSYMTWDRSTFNTSSSGSVAFSQNKSVSRASRALAVVRLTHAQAVTTNSLDANAIDDFQAAEVCPVQSVQWRLGDQYFPNSAVTYSSSAAAGKTQFCELYNYALRGFERLESCDRAPGCSLADYYGTVGTDAAGGDSFAFPVLLERSPTVDNSGLPISSSRVLEFRATLATATSRRVDVYLEYQRAARVGLDRIVVRM